MCQIYRDRKSVYFCTLKINKMKNLFFFNIYICIRRDVFFLISHFHEIYYFFVLFFKFSILIFDYFIS